ncbi:hypothetical protein ACM9HF_03725 [Colwellia sp. RE-S-Sl-9]
MSLTEIKIKLSNALKTDYFFNVVNELYYDERSSKKYLTNALLELHSESVLNINELYKTLKSKGQYHNFWTLCHVYESLLPNIKAPVIEVMECIFQLKNDIGDNISLNQLFSSFTQFCINNEDSYKEAFTISIDNVDKFSDFISSAIIAGSSFDTEWSFNKLNSIGSHKAVSARQQAYLSLSRIDLNVNVTINMAFSFLEKRCLIEKDEAAKSDLFNAAINLGERDECLWDRIDIVLNTLLIEPSPTLLYSVSNVAAFDRKNIPYSIKHKLISFLKNTKVDNQTVLSNIEHLLVKLLKQHEYEYIEDLLEFLLNKDICISEFNYFNSKLIKNNDEYLHALITKWFLSGNLNLCCAVRDLLHDLNIKDIEIKVDVTQVNKLNGMPHFLARKAVGWLFTRPIVAANFVLSIIDVTQENEHEELKKILFETLLMNYSGELRRYLEKKELTSSLAVKNTIQNAITQLNEYFDNMEGVWGINEIQCSQQRREQYWEHFQQLMEDAQEAVPPSVLSELFTTQTILYGNSSAVYIYDGNDQPRRSEMKMSKHSYSTEFPRLDTLDPEGLEYTLRFFRMEVFKNEVNS